MKTDCCFLISCSLSDHPLCAPQHQRWSKKCGSWLIKTRFSNKLFNCVEKKNYDALGTTFETVTKTSNLQRYVVTKKNAANQQNALKVIHAWTLQQHTRYEAGIERIARVREKKTNSHKTFAIRFIKCGKKRVTF